VDVLDTFRCEFDPIFFDVSVESFVTPFDSKNFTAFIVLAKGVHNFSNNYIKTWTEASACRHCSLDIMWVK
jgi:hypothetical protein